MQPLFIATEKFGSWDSESWAKYIEFSGLSHLTEVVSLDSMLCPPILNEVKDEYWPYIVNEDFMLSYFIDLEFLIKKVANISDKNILCVYRNPTSHPTVSSASSMFQFVGYDLVDVEGFNSALSNCGGFPDVFSNQELNNYGLLSSHERAIEVQSALLKLHPDEPHANCHAWAIFRKDMP